MEHEREILDGYEDAYAFLDKMNIHQVRAVSRAFGVNVTTTTPKHELIVETIGVCSGSLLPRPRSKKGPKVKAEKASPECVEKVRGVIMQCKARLPYRLPNAKPVNFEMHDAEGEEIPSYSYTDECIAGILETDETGGGRLRSADFYAKESDPYVSEKIVRLYGLRAGDFISGYLERGENIPRVAQLVAVEGYSPVFLDRKKFEDLTAAYPDSQFFLGGGCGTLDLFDRICPIGFGQRVAVLARHGAGVTSFFRVAAEAAKRAGAVPMFVMLGQRPEEIAEFAAESARGTVAATSFDQPRAQGGYIASLALKRAKRLAECGKDVVLFIDSMTSLYRAYLDCYSLAETEETRRSALLSVKHFFAAARRLVNAGSLTVFAAEGEALGEELQKDFLAAANAQIVLSSELAADGVFPSVSLSECRTQRPYAFFNEREAAASRRIRAALSEGGMQNALDVLQKEKMNSDSDKRIKE